MSPSSRHPGRGPDAPAPVTVYRTRGSRRRRLLYLLLAVAVLAAALVAAMAIRSPASGSQPNGGSRGDPVAAVSKKPSASSSTSAAPSSTVITIGWVGDTTPGSKYGDPPDEGRALFAHMVDPLHAPDLMIANLEGTYSYPGPSKCGSSDSPLCLAFQAPPSFAPALKWSGIDLVSIANNHAHDYLEAGLEQTKATLKKNHIKYTGLPGQITYSRVNGLDVAVLAFSPYSWNASINDIPRAKEMVREATDEADVVVVVMHAGAEGADKTRTPVGYEYAFGENRGNPRAFAHAVIDAGADLVVGSGPHVIRGIERYKDRLIAYSLGNFAGWDNFGLSGTLRLSGLLTVKIDGTGRIHGGRWLSLRLADPGVPAVDPSNTTAHMVTQLSAEDFARTYRLDSQGNFGAH